MIDIASVISHLETDHPTWAVDYAREVQPSLVYNGTPIVYVGYATLKSTIRDKEADFNAFNFNGEGMTQIVETHLVCPVTDFYANFKLLYKSLSGYNPIGFEMYRTAINYTEGGVVGLDNGLMRHLDRWRIGFSTVNNDF